MSPSNQILSTSTNGSSKLLIIANIQKIQSNTNSFTIPSLVSNPSINLQSFENIMSKDQSLNTLLEIQDLREPITEDQTFGSEIWCGEAKYIGGFKENQKQGYGTLQFKDGLYYKGQFQNDNISGYGIASWPDKTYEGFWKNNQKHGKGKESYNDGRIYIGEFIQDKKEGFGEFIWTNGSSFKGFFLNGKQHGQGEFINQSGVSKRGVWENGKRISWIEESAQIFQKISPKEEKCISSSGSLKEGRKNLCQEKNSKMFAA